MKTTPFNTLLASLLAWAFVSSAHADTTYIRIGGAQAFGDAVHRAIAHLFGAAAGTAIPYALGSGNVYSYTGTNISKAQSSIWSGTIGGLPVIIKTSFTGSTDGIRVVVGSVPISFLNDSLLTGATSGGAQLPATGNAAESAVPDAAAADSFQGSTVFSSPALVDKKVGAGAYVFVASKDAPVSVGTFGQPVTDATTAAASPATSYYPGLTNITTQQAQALYNVGNLPLAVFTGVASDRTTTYTPTFLTAGINYPAPAQVFATGRDYGSGARIVTFIEAGIGASTNVVQYKPTITGTSPNALTASQVLYPEVTAANSPFGFAFPAGSDGNPSNGTLATTVLPSSTFATLGGYYVSYLPSLDAANAKAAGAHWLAYNGVSYSPAAVADGSYSLFAFEHIFYRTSATANQQTVLNTFANQLLNTDATLLLSSLHVSRPVDGGIITPAY